MTRAPRAAEPPRDKTLKRERYAERSLGALEAWIEASGIRGRAVGA